MNNKLYKVKIGYAKATMYVTACELSKIYFNKLKKLIEISVQDIVVQNCIEKYIKFKKKATNDKV